MARHSKTTEVLKSAWRYYYPEGWNKAGYARQESKDKILGPDWKKREG